MKLSKVILSLLLLVAFSGASNAADPKTKFEFESLAFWKEAGSEAVLTRLAESGDAMAQYYLGRWYSSDGLGGYTPTEKSIPWYKKAADQGYADAYDGLGEAYEDGSGVTKSQQESLKWYQKAFQARQKLAEQGDKDAQFELAMMLVDDQKGVKEADKAALAWIKKADDSGNKEASLALARFHVDHYLNRISEGSVDDIPSFRAGMHYYRRAGEEAAEEATEIQNEVKAVQETALFLANKGNANDALDKLSVPRQRNLAEAYHVSALLIANGAGTYSEKPGEVGGRADMVLFYFEEAAKRNFPQAQFELGKFYFQKHDKENATRWFTTFGESAAQARSKQGLNTAIQALQQVAQQLQYGAANRHAQELQQLSGRF